VIVFHLAKLAVNRNEIGLEEPPGPRGLCERGDLGAQLEAVGKEGIACRPGCRDSDRRLRVLSDDVDSTHLQACPAAHRKFCLSVLMDTGPTGADEYLSWIQLEIGSVTRVATV
jgi:hypothetical protein